MSEKTIIDTGIIVAFVNNKDNHHAWAGIEIAKLPPPFFTCEAVVAEACYLLRKLSDGEAAVLSMVENELIKIDFSLKKEAAAVRKLMQKYANIPMSLADACLVRMAELSQDAKVFTLDSDFSVYRYPGRKSISVIMPG